MAANFFSVEEIPKRLADFKDMWFKIAQKVEDLSNSRSGFEKGFKNSIKSLSSDLKICSLLVNDLCVSCEHHLPERREDFGECRRGIIGIFDKIRQELEGDIKVLDKYEYLVPEIEEMEKNLESATKSHEEVKKHASKTCTRYETVREGYLRKIDNIKESTDEKIKKINKKFIADVENIFNGYNIFTREKNENIGLDVFFERMIKDPNYHQKVNIVSKGFSLSRKRSDIEARLVLLRYKAKDITKEISPIIDEESRRIARYQEEQKQIYELEIQCSDLKDKEDKLSTRMKIIQSDLNALKSETKGIYSRFRNYEKLLELKEEYVRSFSDTTVLRKGLESLITESFKGYEPPETDVEKRELKGNIKKLKRNVAALNDERAGLKKELNEIKNELNEANADITSKKGIISALEKERDVIKVNLEETSRTLSKTIGERDTLKEEKRNLQRQVQTIEEEKTTLREEAEKFISAREKEKKALENRLQNTINDIKIELEGTSSDLSKTLEERDTLKEEKRYLQRQVQDVLKEKTALREEAEKDKRSVENKLRTVMEDLENTLDGRDDLKENKKRLEDSVVHLETENQKLKKQMEDAISKLEITIRRYERSQNEIRDYKEKLREKEMVLRDIKRNYDKIIVELDKPKSGQKIKKRTVATKKRKITKEPDEKVVEKKIRALREKKRS